MIIGKDLEGSVRDEFAGLIDIRYVYKRRKNKPMIIRPRFEPATSQGRSKISYSSRLSIHFVGWLLSLPAVLVSQCAVGTPLARGLNFNHTAMLSCLPRIR
jgi:hypothetical protein